MDGWRQKKSKQQSRGHTYISMPISGTHYNLWFCYGNCSYSHTGELHCVPSELIPFFYNKTNISDNRPHIWNTNLRQISVICWRVCQTRKSMNLLPVTGNWEITKSHGYRPIGYDIGDLKHLKGYNRSVKKVERALTGDHGGWLNGAVYVWYICLKLRN